MANLPFIKELVNAFDIPVIEQGGVEADDVIGTLAVRAAEDGDDESDRSDGPAAAEVHDVHAVHVHLLLSPDACRNGAVLVRQQPPGNRPTVAGQPPSGACDRLIEVIR